MTRTRSGDVIRPGDVCLDLTQGRPVHVLADTGQNVTEWSEANNYDLLENYGNARLDTRSTDPVFDVAYCSSAQSEPSKSYAMPESRLLRLETEAADGGRPLYERIKQEVLVDLMAEMMPGGDAPGRAEDVAEAARAAGYADDLVSEASEMAHVEVTIPIEEDDDD